MKGGGSGGIQDKICCANHLKLQLNGEEKADELLLTGHN